ncbi:MAG: RNA polymerase sigma-70 factor [Ginsengibacter sp.]
MKKLSIIQIKDLQQRIDKNEEGALKELYDAYGNRLFHFAFAIVHSRETAEEIIEDVFIKVWEKRSRIAVMENLIYYLFTITKNISCNYLRKYNRKKNISLEELSLPYYYINSSPEDLFVTRETLQRINHAINELPPKCRIIFKLVKEDGLKYKEVAALLNLSAKTIENQMGIALKKLHASIDMIFPQEKKYRADKKS